MARSVENQISKQMQNLPPPPPWVEKLEAEHPDLTLCHMMNEELEGLDNMQGGPSIDETTGIREYSKLEGIIDKPEVRQVIEAVFSDLADDGKLSPDIEESYKVAKSASLPYRETPAEHTEGIEKIEETGEGGDTKMAWLPKNLVFLLLDLRGGEPNINPETGLLAFGGVASAVQNVVSAPFRAINSITGTKIGTEGLRIAGTIVGGMLGGPAGAGIGNAAAHWATGNTPMNSLWSGAKNAALVGGIQGAAGMMPGATQGLIGKLGALSPQAGSGLGAFLNNGAGFTGLWGGPAAMAAPSAAGNMAAASQSAPAAIPGAAAPAGGGFLDKIGDMMGHKAFLPAVIAGTSALSFIGQKRLEREQEAKQNDKKREHEQHLQRVGFYDPLNAKKYHRVKNPAYMPTAEDRKRGRYTEPMFLTEEMKPDKYAEGGHVTHSYKEGSIIKGPGDGQADDIRTHIPADSYIIDATSTAHFGNGSSERGAEVLKRVEQRLKKNAHPALMQKLEQHYERHAKPTEVMLSNDEFGFDPISVTLLGKGSIAKGSKALKTMVKNLRKDKSRNGLGLPPPAKDPFHYMKGAL